MNSKTLVSKQKFLDSLSYLVIGVSFITLYFDTKSFDPFNTPKFAALIIIASASTYTIVKHRRFKLISSNKVYKLFVLLLIFFLASGIIAVLFSDSLFIAFIGETQRRNGFLAYLALATLALAASRLVNFANVINLIKITLVTSLIFSLYGIIQMSGADPINWNNPYNSVIATVGNPNFASALMAVFATLSLSILFSRVFSMTFKVLAGMSIIMSLTAIIASNSRQGVVSFVFALAFFISIYLYNSNKKLGVIMFILSIFLSILAVVGMLQKGPLTGLLYKPSVSIRGFYWDAAIEMFKSYPFTGVGFDHYGYYFKELRSVEYPLRVGFDLTSTNAHNTFLQMFSTGGIMLGLSYSLLMVSTLVIGLRLVKNSDSNQRVISLGLLAAWIAFQAQSIISIDNLGISVWGWLLMGVIFGLATSETLQSESNDELNRLAQRKSQISVVPFLALATVLIPALILSVLLVRIESNTLMSKSIIDGYLSQADKNSAQSQQLLRALNQHTNYVLQNKFSDPNYKLQAAYDLFNLGAQKESLNIVKDLALKNPRNLYIHDAVALLSHELDDFASEIQARKRIAELDPWNGKNYLQMLILYKEVGDMINAKKMLDKIQSFAANTPQAKSALEVFSK